jgi:photosystem II stability/assembly factor-like uncharacterized protein
MKALANRDSHLGRALRRATITSSFALVGIYMLLAPSSAGGAVSHSYVVDIFSLRPESWLAICWSTNCSLYHKMAEDQDWLKVSTLPLGVERIFFADSTHGWCLVTTAGKEGEGTTDLWGSKDGGINWELIAHPGRFARFGIGVGDIAFINPSDGWVIGRGSVGRGVVLETNDGGETLRQVNVPPEVNRAVGRISIDGHRQVWLAGNRFIAYKSWDQQGWKLAEVPKELSDYPLGTKFESIVFSEKGTGWVAGSESGPILLSSRNSGKSWEIRQKWPGPGSFNDIAFGNALFGCAVGSDALVSCTHDGGETWSNLHLGDIGELKRIIILPSGEAWIISVSGELYGMKNFSGSWSNIPLSQFEDPSPTTRK